MPSLCLYVLCFLSIHIAGLVADHFAYVYNHQACDPLVFDNYKSWESVLEKEAFKVGEGTFGTIRLLNTSTEQVLMPPQINKTYTSHQIAVKTFSPTEFPSAIRREYSIARTLDHPNIITTYALHTTSNDTNTLYHQFMEYLPYDLPIYFSLYPPSRQILFSLFRQICHGIAYMHSRGIAHLDIKPENILLTSDGVPKIIDFGSAEIVDSPLLHDADACDAGRRQVLTHGISGTEPYMASEVYGEEKYNAQKGDVWALGIIFVQMALQDWSMPWEFAAMEDERFRRFVETDDKDILLGYLPKESRDMVGRMLSLDPEERPLVNEILGSGWLEALEPRVDEM